VVEGGSDIESEAFIPGLEDEPASQSATGRGTFTQFAFIFTLLYYWECGQRFCCFALLIFETLAASDIIGV
jgi:hypothetical protein